ncbi:34780_t:CDS:2 [Gigaspora margarita]|uniref:34780_t:CDS:1 n=1 Tax=Gigaspora margarita TaxID=4874 RepID=A0ABN7UYW4_GIGMA|nr:34780_t:CDS:2 [Gigaspora margarita]
MPIASIRIFKGSKVIHRWYIHSISNKMIIEDFFIKLTNEEISPEYTINIIDPETIERVEINKTQDAPATQKPVDLEEFLLTDSPSHCSQEDFEQLHYLLDPIPEDDLHYKSFEEIYGIQTTENYRPSLLSEKDKALLKQFLDTIFYTYAMSFHDTYDLTMTEPEVEDNTENTISPNEEANEESMNRKDEPEQYESKSAEEKELGENVKEYGKSGEEFDENVESNTHEEISINKLFSRVLLITHCLVLHQIKSHIIQLGSTQLFASNVDAKMLIDQQKINTHIVVTVAVTL